jgi:hypothetical protein
MVNKLLRIWVVVVASGLILGACTYRGADDPVSRKFSWFSYLNGDDIRQTCGTAAPDRYRFIYNAVNVEQIRTYDLYLDAGPKGHRLSIRVIGPSDLSRIGLSDVGDLLNPWRGEGGDVWLLDRDLARLDQAMAESGIFAEAPHGLRLQSYDFYWMVVGCRQGKVFFDAMRWPADPFNKATFPKLLFSWDHSDIAVNQPRLADPRRVYLDRPDENAQNYELRVGDNGLIGGPGLF